MATTRFAATAAAFTAGIGIVILLSKRRRRAPPLLDGTPADVLRFWFSSSDDFRAGLWIHGIHPDASVVSRHHAGKKLTPHELAAVTDAFIRTRWGAALRAAPLALEAALEQWLTTPEGMVAAVVLLSEFSRAAGRGTAAMFTHDALACRLAVSLLDDAPAATSLPWPHRFFLYRALLEVEDEEMLERGALGLRDLAEEEAAVGAEHETLLNLQRAARMAIERHCKLFRRFGRFPARNALLGRESTAAELVHLKCQKCPPWHRGPVAAAAAAAAVAAATTSVAPPESERRTPPEPALSLAADEAERQGLICPPDAAASSVAPPTRPLRLLVLHGRKQSAKLFERSTRKALHDGLVEVAELIYAEAPREVGGGGLGREWWNAMQGASTYTYLGLEDTLRFVDE